LLTLRDSTYRATTCGVKRWRLSARGHTDGRTRARGVVRPHSPTEEEEPPHKCQCPAAEHFLSSISVNKRRRAQ